MRSFDGAMGYQTFEERFEYLKLNGQVCQDTFGYDRYLNQEFYKSAEWKQIRAFVITRDNGCDLGCQDRPILGTIYIHHINPISADDIIHSNIDLLLNPNNLICVSQETHNALHYGNINNVSQNKVVQRNPNDTCPWKK